MSWRTVVITNRCKLDLKMGYMVIRTEDTKRIFIDEIATLVIENNAVSMTGCLLEELINKKVRVLFCDSKRNPLAELTPLYGSHDCSRKLHEQSKWNYDIKTSIWTEIVAEKIRNQSNFLKEIGKIEEASLLDNYIKEMSFGDISNREGHAAKVYFNAIFGMDFTRSEDCYTNSALNYGYNVLLSAFNREIYANGYSTQLGIHHENIYNKFNLSSDIMEPFRILVDRIVYKEKISKFDVEEKHLLLDMYNQRVIINNTEQTVLNAIKIYTASIFNAIENKNVSEIKFVKI